MIFKMAGVFFEVFYALCCIFLIVFIFWYFCDRKKRKGGEDISTSDGLYGNIVYCSSNYISVDTLKLFTSMTLN